MCPRQHHRKHPRQGLRYNQRTCLLQYPRRGPLHSPLQRLLLLQRVLLHLCPPLSLRLLPRTCRLHHRLDGLRRNLQSCHCQRHHSHLLTCQHRNRHRHRRMCLRQYRHRGPQRIQLHCRLCSQLLLPPRNQRLSPGQHQRTCQLRNLQNFPRHSRRYCQRSSRL